MKTPVKATLVTIAVVVVMVIAALIYVLVNQSQSAPPSSGGGDASPQVVRESSHVLDDGGEGAVTLVEFLDFECERGADGANTGYAFPEMLVDVVRLSASGERERVSRIVRLHANSREEIKEVLAGVMSLYQRIYIS